MILFLCLLPTAYLVFVFISESLNPFVIVKNPMHRGRWRLGRTAAIVTVIGGFSALVAMQLFATSLRLTAGMFLGIAFVLMAPSVVKYQKRRLWP